MTNEERQGLRQKYQKETGADDPIFLQMGYTMWLEKRIAEWKIWADATIQVLQLYKFDSQKIEILQATMPKENEE